MKRNRGLITPIKPDLVLTPSTNHIYPALIEACRRDFYCFAMLCMAELNGDEALLHNFHLEALAFQLVGVLEGRCPRLILTCRLAMQSRFSFRLRFRRISLDAIRRDGCS